MPKRKPKGTWQVKVRPKAGPAVVPVKLPLPEQVQAAAAKGETADSDDKAKEASTKPPKVPALKDLAVTGLDRSNGDDATEGITSPSTLSSSSISPGSSSPISSSVSLFSPTSSGDHTGVQEADTKSSMMGNEKEDGTLPHHHHRKEKDDEGSGKKVGSPEEQIVKAAIDISNNFLGDSPLLEHKRLEDPLGALGPNLGSKGKHSPVGVTRDSGVKFMPRREGDKHDTKGAYDDRNHDRDASGKQQSLPDTKESIGRLLADIQALQQTPSASDGIGSKAKEAKFQPASSQQQQQKQQHVRRQNVRGNDTKSMKAKVQGRKGRSSALRKALIGSEDADDSSCSGLSNSGSDDEKEARKRRGGNFEPEEQQEEKEKEVEEVEGEAEEGDVEGDVEGEQSQEEQENEPGSGEQVDHHHSNAVGTHSRTMEQPTGSRKDEVP